MKIDVHFTPLGLVAGDLAGRGVVVVDALRATTTIVTALANGAKAVIPAATSEEAVRLASNLEKDGVVLAGERRSVKMEGFALGNSPREMTAAAVAGKTIVLATTNGTPALVATQGGDPVLVGAPANFKALAARARANLAQRGALAVGLFLGLTLLRLPITGSWGDQIGSRLWRVLGVGSVLLPVLGIGWALAAFERLGSLSAGRAAALGAGLILLLPYGIGTVTGAGFPSAYAAWSPTQKLVGLIPAVLAHGVHQAVGTAGGTLVGLFVLSALGILTVGWHPLVALRTRETAIGKRDAGSGMRDGKGGTRDATKPEKPQPVAADEERDRRVAALKQAKARNTKATPPPSRIPHLVPAGVLIPPIELLHPAPPEDGDA